MVKYEIIKEREPTTEDRLAAAGKLSGAGFKLYCYLEGFPCGASTYLQKDFMKEMNIIYRTAVSAFEELIKFNYLYPYSETIYFFVPEQKIKKCNKKHKSPPRTTSSYSIRVNDNTIIKKFSYKVSRAQSAVCAVRASNQLPHAIL